MWGLAVGLVIGIFQVTILAVMSKMLFDGKARMLAVVLLLLKVALIALILYLISTVSLAHVIWTAGGMLAGLVTTLAVLNRRSQKIHNRPR